MDALHSHFSAAWHSFLGIVKLSLETEEAVTVVRVRLMESES